jgi:MT0933-like antitoxin protein
MGIFDKAKDLPEQHNDQVAAGLHRGAVPADSTTGPPHSERIDQAPEPPKDTLDELAGGRPQPPATA